MTLNTNRNRPTRLTTSTDDGDLHPAAWWRRLCFPIDRLAVSGDLDTAGSAVQRQVEEWLAAGITDVIDVRCECNDKSLLARLAPGIDYHWFGTDDDGLGQPEEWFDAGVAAASAALADPDRRVLVHCHMGVNRAPSMAFAILLHLGHEPIEALRLIREARPIAAISYAHDALRWWHGRTVASSETRERDVDAVRTWLTDNYVGAGWVIHRMRRPV